ACMDLDPNAKGGVNIGFSVGPSGSVANASIGSSSLKNPRIEGCVLRVFNRLKFPSADKPTNASFPFLFKSSKR
ncbi:MAG TPA: AgmX/PglI C-terminal domain-containing protein, partial [Polyangiaceae bacterium]|nr:AgmX/PglI C-terminal domain-containing protein [Polyangiaceae bacterium]